MQGDGATRPSSCDVAVKSSDGTWLHRACLKQLHYSIFCRPSPQASIEVLYRKPLIESLGAHARPGRRQGEAGHAATKPSRGDAARWRGGGHGDGASGPMGGMSAGNRRCRVPHSSRHHGDSPGAKEVPLGNRQSTHILNAPRSTSYLRLAGQLAFGEINPHSPLRAAARISRIADPSPCSWSSAAKRPAKVRTNASMGPVTSRPSPADQSASVAMA